MNKCKCKFPKMPLTGSKISACLTRGASWCPRETLLQKFSAAGRERTCLLSTKPSKALCFLRVTVSAKSSLYIYIKYTGFGWFEFYGISTDVGYLMPNHLYTYILNI